MDFAVDVFSQFSVYLPFSARHNSYSLSYCNLSEEIERLFPRPGFIVPNKLDGEILKRI